MPADPLATSFGAAASVYDRGRPGYPAAAVAWMLASARVGAEPLRVADVGAGTGKLTRALVGAGAEPVAIDPDPQMLAVLRQELPGIRAREGAAEHLPLPDASMDAVVLGQAWHWVDPVAGCAEIARVLRPGGVLGLIWNIRDRSVPWVARLGEIMGGSHAENLLDAGDPTITAPFAALEKRQWRWSRTVTRADLIDLVHSRSAIIAASESERARIDADGAALFDRLGAIADRTVELPYITIAYRAVRPD